MTTSLTDPVQHTTLSVKQIPERLLLGKPRGAKTAMEKAAPLPAFSRGLDSQFPAWSPHAMGNQSESLSGHPAPDNRMESSSPPENAQIEQSEAIPLALGSSQLPCTAMHSLRLWSVFIVAILLSCFIHELGHCAAAWVQDYPAVPTPAKEYILKPMPENIHRQVALGGLLGSVAALFAAMLWLHLRPAAAASALLAGAMTAPGFYTVRFVLAGRGHDSTEFQEAQAAVGLRYSGHSADWLFVGLFVLSAGFWFWRVRPAITLRFVGRLILGAVVAILAMVLLQSINNALFDPLLQQGSSAGLKEFNDLALLVPTVCRHAA